MLHAILSKTKLPQPKLCPDDVYDVILSCMRLDRSARLHPSQLALMLESVAYSHLSHVASSAALKWPSLDQLHILDAKDREAEANLHDYHVDLDVDTAQVRQELAAFEVDVKQVTLGTELHTGTTFAVSSYRV